MSFGDLVWLFFIFSAIQPMLQQRMLEAMRVRKLGQLESERKSRVILLVHRQETMRLLGFPVARYIDINDSEEVLRAIQMTDEKVPLDLVLHTPGGLVLAALQIAKAVRDHKAKVTVFVPHYAMSGGTLIALAADEIVMCAHSVLGPIDPQIGQSPAASLIKVVDGEADRESRRSDACPRRCRTQGHPASQGVRDRPPATSATRRAGERAGGEARYRHLDARLSDLGVDSSNTWAVREHRHAECRARSHEALSAARAGPERRRRRISSCAAPRRTGRARSLEYDPEKLQTFRIRLCD